MTFSGSIWHTIAKASYVRLKISAWFHCGTTLVLSHSHKWVGTFHNDVLNPVTITAALEDIT